MKFAPAPKLVIGTHHVTFEETTLDNVIAIVGAGSIAHHGDASESTYWLCYRIRTARHSELLWLTSNGEMGGGEHSVTGITAVKVPHSTKPQDCPSLPPDLANVHIPPNLWLGTSVATVLHALGPPSHKSEDWWTYTYETKVRGDGRCDGGFDRIASLDVKIEHGLVVSIQTEQVTSC